jgi:hypothetical protein
MNNNKVYITFDYELFFGRSPGSIERSILGPTNRLIEIGRRRKVAFTFFVDAGMLVMMKKYADVAPELKQQYEEIAIQLQTLKKEGHSVQLHIHPHWENCVYAEGRWIIDASRYRLDQFSSEDVMRVISEYKGALEEVIGPGIHAFRAGGWCIQPFSRIGNALRQNGITLDSTLYRDGHMNTPTHQFDFRGMPSLNSWLFEDDPMQPVKDGWFTEIPISVTRYSRLFYFSMVFHRLMKTERYRFVGDGVPIGGSKINMLKLILSGGQGVVSLDGFRVRRLQASFTEFSKKNKAGNFVAIGHPKALCDESFTSLDIFAESFSELFAVM